MDFNLTTKDGKNIFVESMTASNISNVKAYADKLANGSDHSAVLKTYADKFSKKSN